MSHGTEKSSRDGFGFSLEAELLLVDAASFEPLWYRDLQFDHLCGVLESISLEGLPAMEGLPVTAPHRLALPYFVAGFEVRDRGTVGLLPKGVGIRTPFLNPSECLETFDLLQKRLQKALGDVGYQAVAVPYHPVEENFHAGPKDGRPYEEWISAASAMLSYGLSLNLKVPAPLICELAPLSEIDERVNHYIPSLVELSLASPLYGGRLWMHEGRVGKGVRTYKQSGFEPVLVTPSEGCFEFKPFEMSVQLRDLHAYFQLCMALLLDPDLKGRTNDARRALDMSFVGMGGPDGNRQSRAREVLEGAFHILPKLGLDPAPLKALVGRLDSGRVPADEIIESYRKSKSIPSVLRDFGSFVSESETDAARARAVASF